MITPRARHPESEPSLSVAIPTPTVNFRRLALVMGVLQSAAFLPAEDPNPSLSSAAPPSESETIVQEGNKVELVEDASLDEALDRRPDLAFANVSLDQENSGVSLSSIPAQAVASAEVLKAATPDLDADTRGSILRVKYKPSYELEDRLISGRAYTRYKEIYQSFGWLGDFSWAQSIGENAGFRATFEAEDIQRGSDAYDVDWGEHPAAATGEPYINRITQLNNRRDHTTYRFNGSADYRFSEGNDIYLRLAYEEEDYSAISSNVQLRYGDEEDFSELTRDTGRTTDGRIMRFGSQWREIAEDVTVTLGGNNTIGPVELEWRGQHRSLVEDELFDDDVRFIREGLSFGYTDARTAIPRVVYPENDTSDLYPLSSYDNSTQLDEITASVAAVDLRWADGFLKEGDYFKFGVKGSRDQREIQRNLSAYDVNAMSTLRLSDALSPFTRDDFIGEGFSPGAVPDAGITKDYISANPDILELDALLSARRSFPGSYDVQQEINAAYTMMNWQGDRLRVVAGVRYENTELSAVGNEVIVNGDDFVVQPNHAANDYDQVFPGLHIQYDLSEKLKLFGSSTKTIQRPAFSYTAPFRIIDVEDSELTIGSPDLRATLYQNYDLSLDFQPHKDLLVSGEIFYRDITDPVYRQTEILTSGEFTGFELRQLRNGDPATQHGAKVLVQHALGSLAPELEPWSWSFAYTFRETEAAYPQRPNEALPLINAPTDRIDTSVSFRGDRAFVQLGLDYRSAMLMEVGENGPLQDRFYGERVMLNLKAEHKLNARFTAFVDWKNLLSEYERDIVQGPTDRASYYQYDPWAVLAGMRFKL